MWVYNVNNKGFELSLKAIFTMIAGAVILLFFIQFAFDQQTVQEKVQTRTSLADLDDQLDAFAISSSHTQTLSFPQQVSLSFSCKGLQLEDYARKLRAEIKYHDEVKEEGQISKLFYDDGYGFLKTRDGREVYFHENAILNKDFENLQLGEWARFNIELGDKGPQVT
ncbi:MAG: cold shock domain-containing protein, partial [Nanoarchaeota archaeon]